MFLTQGRASLTPEKQRFAHEHGEMKNLEDIVKDIKPSVLIGNFFDFKAMTLFFAEKKWGCGFVWRQDQVPLNRVHLCVFSENTGCIMDSIKQLKKIVIIQACYTAFILSNPFYRGKNMTGFKHLMEDLTTFLK